ncbi:MAG: hypothetical protein IM607_07725 [Cytophagales bacterium]|nr:hypothetical protein [Cytophagales bacterium]
MFKSIVNLFEDVTRIVTAPVEVFADTAQVVTKPIADIAQDVVDAAKGLIDD